MRRRVNSRGNGDSSTTAYVDGRRLGLRDLPALESGNCTCADSPCRRRFFEAFRFCRGASLSRSSHGWRRFPQAGHGAFLQALPRAVGARGRAFGLGIRGSCSQGMMVIMNLAQVISRASAHPDPALVPAHRWPLTIDFGLRMPQRKLAVRDRKGEVSNLEFARALHVNPNRTGGILTVLRARGLAQSREVEGHLVWAAIEIGE